MPQEIAEVKLETSKGKPSVEIIFGQAHLGNYRCFLWDASGKNSTQLAHGNNIDDVLDVFTIPNDPADLNQRIFSYEVIIQAAEAKEGQLYSLTIMVRQNGDVCTGGLIQETGKLEDVKSLIGFRRFTV